MPTLQGRAGALEELLTKKDEELRKASEEAKLCRDECDYAKRKAAGLTYDLDKATDKIRSMFAENQRLKKLAGIPESPKSSKS